MSVSFFQNTALSLRFFVIPTATTKQQNSLLYAHFINSLCDYVNNVVYYDFCEICMVYILILIVTLKRIVKC